MIKELEKYIDRELISADEISRRVKELGAEITKDYEGKSVIMVCILRGASVFFADLVREIDVDLSMDFMVISSYGSGTTSSGEVKLIKYLSEGIKGKNVIVVEDIVDTGLTLSNLKAILAAREPASVKICTLLDKPSRRTVDLTPDYVGFTIPNEFVVGYGLDWAERYRQLKNICTIDTSKI